MIRLQVRCGSNVRRGKEETGDEDLGEGDEDKKSKETG